ncbi:hypothetical protein [Phocaeicola sartorii]|uniref:hypothetical protein n=1 Tax=Phocaeicola sartorii TaxID=671267 RepID=UPI002557D5E4|nr:hypothetical protein [Phocaeicola sartorii]
MARRHYKGEPRRPDGESMLMLCIMTFIYGPVFFTAGHFLYGSPVFECFTVAMIVALVATLLCLWRGWIYPPSRRKAVMRHYAGRRFSPSRCYIVLFSLAFLLIAEMFLLPSALMRIDGNKAEPVKDTQTEVLQGQRDYLALHFAIGARQEVSNEALQRLINQDERTPRNLLPVYIMQVREKDMAGEFRVELLNHATFEEIQDGSRKFIECTWVVGRDSVGAASDYLTCWYELCEDEVVLVTSHKWNAGQEF